MDRYKVEGPKGDNSDEDLEGWRRAVENAKAQLQHQRLRNVNAQLLKKYGSAAWNAYSYQLTGLIKILEVELVEAQQEVEGINKRRKISQVSRFVPRRKLIFKPFIEYIDSRRKNNSDGGESPCRID